MEIEVLDSVIQRITSAPIIEKPYSHFHIEEIFPEAFYLELINNIPDTVYFSKFVNYPYRSSFTLIDENLALLPDSFCMFWQKLAANFSSLTFISTLFKKFQLHELFGNDLSLAKPGIDMLLVRDQPGYFIGPHTDHPNKILTLLFYLPLSQDQKYLGTSIYIPKDCSAKYRGDEHHSFEEFNKISTMPFVRNSVFGFARSDCSFHGVEPIHQKEKERISFCYTLWKRQ